MASYKNETFEGKSITLDGNEYIDCHFKLCNMIYAGGECTFSGNGVNHNCTWTLSQNAGRTILFLAGLYKMGATNLIENTFELIRGKPMSGGMTVQ